MIGYKFTLEELRPVIKVEKIGGNGISFWFAGENTDLPPQQTILDPASLDGWQVATRPNLKDRKTVELFEKKGEHACIQYINTRIANYLLDEFEKVRESCPMDLENQYLKKIDEFYLWFWDRRERSDQKIFERFLNHIHSIRTKNEKLQTWYTIKEASAYLRTSVTKLRELIEAGTLKSYRLDSGKTKSTILLHRLDLDATILFDHSSGLNQRELARLKKYQQ